MVVVVVEVMMYRNGFTVGIDGPYRRMDDPANERFLLSLADAETPDELPPNSTVQVVDKSHTEHSSLLTANDPPTNASTNASAEQDVEETAAASPVSSTDSSYEMVEAREDSTVVVETPMLPKESEPTKDENSNESQEKEQPQKDERSEEAPALERTERKEEPHHVVTEEGATAAEADNTVTTSATVVGAVGTVPPARLSPEKSKRPPVMGKRAGSIHPKTPIHNSDASLRLLRKFATKSGLHLPVSAGGTQRTSMLGMLFGSGGSTKFPENDASLGAYSQFIQALQEGTDSSNSTPPPPLSSGASEEADIMVESILGHDGDTMHKSRAAMACFVRLVGIWCHATSRYDVHDGLVITPTLLTLAMDVAESLVAHGCLDGVLISIVPENENVTVSDTGAELVILEEDGEDETSSKEYVKAIYLMAEGLFVADLSTEVTELSALKFFLTTGTRQMPPDDEAMLRGSHLLQTIRLCYHVYRKTVSEPNKTTARAALQQLVASSFHRMERRTKAMAAANNKEEHKEYLTAMDDMADLQPDTFPSPDHKDVFLVLRSLCKMSMRSLPDPSKDYASPPAMASTMTGEKEKGDVATNTASGDAKPEGHPMRARAVSHDSMSPHPAMMGTVDDALESKILALELILYVLQNTNMSREFVQNSGPQFHYAIRQYLCVSLLKNCTSHNTMVVNLSLRLFVPLIHHFRSNLKTEIEAFVTNVFFVILNSENSTVEHKSLVVTLFEEICSDPTTLAEIFLNYDCDLSAVDLFHRIIMTLAKVAKINEKELGGNGLNFVAGAGALRMEKVRQEHRELRLDAMRALRQVLASLHSSIVAPMNRKKARDRDAQMDSSPESEDVAKSPNGNGIVGAASAVKNGESVPIQTTSGKQTLVQIYDSKKKRREEEAEAILRFSQKPSAGISYAGKCGLLDGSDPSDVARYLLQNKDVLEKTQIGDYLGREAHYQNGFALNVLNAYVEMMDFQDLEFDDAIRYYLSGFRLPGEAQKIDRIMEKFAERYTIQNPSIFPSADVAFILAFSIIMLNTDLHNPSIKEDRRMTKEGFVRNNRGICDGQDLPAEILTGIFDRIQQEPISLKEDDDARQRVGGGDGGGTVSSSLAGVQTALSPAVFFGSHYMELDKARETNFQKERDQIVRNTESVLRRKRQGKHASVANSPSPSGQEKQAHKSSYKSSHLKFVRTEDTGLCDEYVSPMFEVTWAPSLAVFSTAMESANGTLLNLSNFASEDEMELAAENAAASIEVSLTAFRLAICTAGLCGNETARDAFVHGLLSFSLLGTGRLMEYRHIRCVQALLKLGRDDGELLGSGWEHIFKALSEINRLHQVFQLMARNDRAAATRQRRRFEREEARMEREGARTEREEARMEREAENSRDPRNEESMDSVDQSVDQSRSEDSYDESVYSERSFTDSESDSFYDVADDDLIDEAEMDKRAIDEANARSIYDAISESLVDAIYHRSSSLSSPSIQAFILQLCRVSRMEISGYGGHVGSRANTIDLTTVHYRQQHSIHAGGTQPNIYSLQKLVEVAHYNMGSRPRLIFADIWTTVSAHLTSTALHSNAAVAIYAVDSFRQLSIQFLQREELGVFEFQRRFLKPFETVMSRSEHFSTKEILLNSIQQIITMFGSDLSGTDKHKVGTLRSGWRPILSVLGIAGHDSNDEIASMAFQMLTDQLQQCIAPESSNDNPQIEPTTEISSVLLAERFVDLVDALLTFVSGPREEMSIKSIDHLMTLSNFLADDSVPLPLIKNRSNSVDMDSNSKSDSKELELWWPILLGLSQTVGDSRQHVRIKGLNTLLGIINEHFFSALETENSPDVRAEAEETTEEPHHGDLQTLQLIFRGVLTPTLEHAETDFIPGESSAPPLPDDFDHFTTPPPLSAKQRRREADAAAASEEPNFENGENWLDTTFDQLLDGCISICLRSIEVYGTDALVEEILAMLNSCLLSDSGVLAVRGLRRLHTFITDDLDDATMTDDTWATVSHMLRRCLNVRGLPPPTNATDNIEQANDLNDSINEFVLEDRILSGRRYVGSNATMIIGSLLNEKDCASSISLRWYIFLVAGLGNAVKEWERAASLIAAHTSSNSHSKGEACPPHYLENSLYGRKWMSRFVVNLLSREDFIHSIAPMNQSDNPSPKTSTRKKSASQGQQLLKEHMHSLLSALVDRESSLDAHGPGSDLSDAARTAELTHISKLVCSVLEAYGNLDPAVLSQCQWLTKSLSFGIQSNSKVVRTSVHNLLQHFLNEGGESVPTPPSS
mmetsp:Transcript_26007/g.47138  ORF Transcript_26007/g.47138 Transcript_26007/m.47138 type:complete len:2256 (-) Transcript_26007:305-7072(-)